jgi:hypothetical protein
MGYEQNTMKIAETNWQLIRNAAEIKKRSLSCILFIVGLACVSNCQRIAKETKMNLQVQLKVRTTALIFQENPICRLNLVNSGQTELQVLHPMFNPHMPIMRLIHVQTGVEVLRQGKAPMSGDRYQSLPPGQERLLMSSPCSQRLPSLHRENTKYRRFFRSTWENSVLSQNRFVSKSSRQFRGTSRWYPPQGDGRVCNTASA